MPGYEISDSQNATPKQGLETNLAAVRSKQMPLVAGAITDESAHFDERRRHPRIKLTLRGRYMLADGSEYPCETVDVSPFGIAIKGRTAGVLGERVVAYIQDLGRVEGGIVRRASGWFAVEICAPACKRERLAKKIAWLVELDEGRLSDLRRSARVEMDFEPITLLADGQEFSAELIDASMDGAAVRVGVSLRNGTKVILGGKPARVVRRFGGELASSTTRWLLRATGVQTLLLWHRRDTATRSQGSPAAFGCGSAHRASTLTGALGPTEDDLDRADPPKAPGWTPVVFSEFREPRPAKSPFPLAAAQGDSSYTKSPAKKPAAKTVKAKMPAPVVTLKHIAAEIAEAHEVPKNRAESMLADTVDRLAKHLVKGNKVRIVGLGIFQVKRREAWMSRNPQTGEAVKIKASKKVTFRAGKELKEAV
jgi:nucleoid DNA-binding protein